MKLTKVQVRTRRASMQSISKLRNPEPRELGSEQQSEECTWQCDNENRHTHPHACADTAGKPLSHQQVFWNKNYEKQAKLMKAFGGMFLQRSSSFLCVSLRKSPLSPLIPAASQRVFAVALCRENAVCHLCYICLMICLIFFLWSVSTYCGYWW